MFNVKTKNYDTFKRTDKGWLGEYAIGTRISKKFDGEPFAGTITGYDPFLKCYNIKYDDGDVEDLDNEEVKPLIIKETGAGAESGESVGTETRTGAAAKTDLDMNKRGERAGAYKILFHQLYTYIIID